MNGILYKKMYKLPLHRNNWNLNYTVRIVCANAAMPVQVHAFLYELYAFVGDKSSRKTPFSYWLYWLFITSVGQDVQPMTYAFQSSVN